jgi:hypothetical protein
MYNLSRDLIDALRVTPDTLTGLLVGVTQEQAQKAKGGDEGWSVVEILCHLRDAEEYGLQRDILMRDRDNPDILPWDQEKLAVERNYAAQDLRAALASFIALRQHRIAVLEGLSPEGWKRTGNHPQLGTIDIFSHVLHMVSHDAIHCAQIARQILDE